MSNIAALFQYLESGSRAEKSGLIVPAALLIIVAVLLLFLALETAYLLVRYIRLHRKLALKSGGATKERGAVTSVEIGKLHEQGKRQYQQDSFGVSDNALMQSHGLLAIVADGMGGLADGDKVSTTAVEEILDNFVLYQGKGTPEQALLVLAHQAVKKVNSFLGEENLRKSGSTLVMGLIKNSMLSTGFPIRRRARAHSLAICHYKRKRARAQAEY